MGANAGRIHISGGWLTAEPASKADSSTEVEASQGRISSRRQNSGGRSLFLEPINQNAVADARRISRLADLECHELAVGGDHRVRRFAALVVVEMGEAGEIFSGAVQAELPDINVAVATFAAELLALAIGFDRRVESVGENAFGFVVCSRSFLKNWSPLRSQDRFP